jgi:hypothetical protein
MGTVLKETIADLVEKIENKIDEEAEAQSNRECIERFLNVVCQMDEVDIHKAVIDQIQSKFGKSGFKVLLEVFVAACEAGRIKVCAEVEGQQSKADSPKIEIDHGSVALVWFALDKKTSVSFQA